MTHGKPRISLRPDDLLTAYANRRRRPPQTDVTCLRHVTLSPFGLAFAAKPKRLSTFAYYACSGELPDQVLKCKGVVLFYQDKIMPKYC